MLRTHLDIQARFEALSTLLKNKRVLWETRPFVEIRPQWENEFPDLANWLRERSHSDIDRIEEDWSYLNHLEAPQLFLDWHEECNRLVHLESFATEPSEALSEKSLRYGIPARKWAQIRIFVETCRAILPSNIQRVVDWCAGKGHVSRMFNLATQIETRALEKRPDLCDIGRKLAHKQRLQTCEFCCLDVLEDETSTHFNQAQAGIALHACGHLTDELFTQAIEHQLDNVISVPCCYHNLGGKKFHSSQSNAARESGLEFTQANLRLATAHETVARIPIRVARRREMAYRLGLDLLFREATGIDTYHQQGPFPKALFDGDFKIFCETVSEELNLPLPHEFDADAAEIAGRKRALEARALSLVRACYRRPLELWLILDRAMRLVEANRKVQVGLFCDARITPRNIMIVSQLA